MNKLKILGGTGMCLGVLIAISPIFLKSDYVPTPPMEVGIMGYFCGGLLVLISKENKCTKEKK